ncbi:MAG: proline--tRNA ligase [Candidatus Lokiarchaeota archaeon]|nr:proline--tRNA ligase [Candidatus Lokiarchaeota archaeon]
MSDKSKEEVHKLPKKENIDEWYSEILLRAQIIDKRIQDSRGFYGYPPYGTRMMIELEKLLINELDKTGHEPIRTPTVIPWSLLEIEQEHAEGFVPEVWKITQGRESKELNIPKVLRPTGETLIYSLFHYWIRSHLDLPLKIYECRPSFRAEPDNAIVPFLRTHEFFWIESHCAFSSYDGAVRQVREDMEIFEKIIWNELAIPFRLYKRPEWDKFPGADYTCAYDAPLENGKVIQIGTTHNLGYRFAKPFNVKFQNENNEEELASQTCFGPGISRIIGALILIHGDDQGLVLPPILAPIQFVIVPIIKKENEDAIRKYSEEIKNILNSVARVKIDYSDNTPGSKFYVWEERGVPFRIEVGPKELDKQEVMIVRRLDRKKQKVEKKNLINIVPNLYETLIKDMQNKTKELFKIARLNSIDELSQLIEDKIHLIITPFCDDEACIELLKDQYNLKVRGIPLFQKNEKDIDECEENYKIKDKKIKCHICNERPAKREVHLARQY